jgi:hypothetical protein
MEFQDPWFAATPKEQAGLEAEFALELPAGHVLARVPVTCLARCRDQDDVLFRLDDGTGRVALVHLTWKCGPEREPTFPHAVMYETAELWRAAMKADRAGSEG